MVELEHARALLEQMGLQTAAQLLDAQLEQSLHTQQTYVQFLNELLSSEQQQRQRKSRETRLKLARLPHRKGLEDFDFAFQPSIDKRQVEELGTLAFVARRKMSSCWDPLGWAKPTWLLVWRSRRWTPAWWFITPPSRTSLQI